MKGTVWLLGLEAVAIAAVLTVSLDLREHGRVEALGGVNIWGYRGPVAHQKQPHEIRVAVVGGTRAFGWGGPASALVSEVRRVVMLTTDRPGAELRPVVVVNLGRLGALPASYPDTIAHYAYLQPDYICLYDDLGVPGGSPTSGTDGASAVFQLTGYAPALPLVLREKGMAWRFGDVKYGYGSRASDSAPPTSLLHRAAGRMLEWVGRRVEAADRALAGLLPAKGRDATSGGDQTADYAAAMMTALAAAHQRARGVVLALSPAETVEQTRNRRALTARLQVEAGSAPWLRVVDLGTEPALRDAALRVDGWNYGSDGLSLVANRIAPALLNLIVTP